MNNVLNILKEKNIVINNSLINLSIKKELSLKEFIVLAYLLNSYSNSLDIDLISKSLNISATDIMECINNLVLKNIISIDTQKDVEDRYQEVINLDKYYMEVLSNIKGKEVTKKESKDLFVIFEKELGRTMSPMELEQINKWLDDGNPEELILGALKEATFNNVRSFSYIDKILYEWSKKGYKTVEDIDKNNKRHQEKEVTKKEQEISSYNWLDND
jgi:DNA replication protein